ncbi:Serine/threonine-protein kinase WNK2 [Zea mays]|uniref:Uncharacterized protein n=1 Tax=Zea mays TaxID=4577 RepID=C0PEM4_MAIZE|nr:Serine/threonine-protein kinase WNK2 [Zea mays]ACN33640.1 unknown [Zea mays]|eukprot:NP_001169399.1 uncharacterized protein LOC100383268 [Zea mays]
MATALLRDSYRTRATSRLILPGVQRDSRQGVLKDCVPGLRRAPGHGGGVEPGAAARLPARPGGAGAPLRRDPPAQVPPPPRRHAAPRVLGRRRRAPPRRQLRHRALHLRHAAPVPPPAPAGRRRRGPALVPADPRRPRLPPRARRHPPRPQVRQHLRQRQPGPGQDRRLRPRHRGPPPRLAARGALRRGHAGVHGARGVRGGLRRARRRLLVRHVRPRDGHARVPLQRVRAPRAHLQESHLRDKAGGSVQGERPRGEAVHRQVPGAGVAAAERGRAAQRPVPAAGRRLRPRLRRRRGLQRHVQLPAPARVPGPPPPCRQHWLHGEQRGGVQWRRRRRRQMGRRVRGRGRRWQHVPRHRPAVQRARRRRAARCWCRHHHQGQEDAGRTHLPPAAYRRQRWHREGPEHLLPLRRGRGHGAERGHRDGCGAGHHRPRGDPHRRDDRRRGGRAAAALEAGSWHGRRRRRRRRSGHVGRYRPLQELPVQRVLRRVAGRLHVGGGGGAARLPVRGAARPVRGDHVPGRRRAGAVPGLWVQLRRRRRAG